MTPELLLEPPSPALAPFVELIWGVRAGPSELREAVIPNGATELMVNFGPTQKVWAYGDRTADDDFGRFWLAGVQDQPLVIGSPAGCDHFGVRFRPGGAHRFFGLPMDELTDQVVDLDLVVGRAASQQLRDRLLALPSHRARAREAEAWLLERRYAVHPYYATVRRALDLVHGSDFRMGVGEICARLGLSNRHLIQQFREVVGLTPKTMSRVARFHAVVAAVAGVPPSRVSWSRLSARFGYADQSHLVREFRSLAGVTPGAFLARRTEDFQHVAVDGAPAAVEPLRTSG
jgi:AraC-like DNA-binding protein